jgi:hypothetical protein
VPRRSQRTRSILTFFAQDAATHNLVYANADLTKASHNAEVLAFCDHWRALTGSDPAQLVFDGRLTTQAQLGVLNQRGVRFVTLRTRFPAVTKHIAEIPPTRWRTIHLERDGNYTTPKVVDEKARLSIYPVPIRQLLITGLGHDQPTALITNDFNATPKKIIERYGQRMTIEQRLGEAIRAFHLDALSSAVPLNIDLDVVMSVLAGAVCASLRKRLPGYATTTPDTLQRRFLSTSGTITHDGQTVVVHLDRRTYSPVLRAADIPDVTVPWWQGRHLHFEYD